MFDELKLKSLGDYHDLYVQSDTLLVPDIFENFRNKCIETEKELEAEYAMQYIGMRKQIINI